MPACGGEIQIVVKNSHVRAIAGFVISTVARTWVHTNVVEVFVPLVYLKLVWPGGDDMT